MLIVKHYKTVIEAMIVYAEAGEPELLRLVNPDDPNYVGWTVDWHRSGKFVLKRVVRENEGDRKMNKPDWWPKNPYPASVFTMPEDRYLELVPDPELRTALSGMLGRRFWDIASEAIWAALREADEEAL